MNTKILLSLLCATFLCLRAAEQSPTATATTPASAYTPAKRRIEVCFVLDTTGSMGGLIEGAKQKIWSIANAIIAAEPAPEVSFGLVGYRDRGDAYITKLTPLTPDLDTVYGDLRKFQAEGGGDTPESVNQALHEAVHKLAWSQDRNVLKLIYLVGDAPPHMDYADGPDYRTVCEDALKHDLLINTVQCGNLPGTREIWADIARRGEGRFVALEQSGNMVVVDTPFDKDLTTLNLKMGTTMVGYGSAAVQQSVSDKQAAAVAATPAVIASRLAYNLASGGARGGRSVQGEGELLDALKDGKVTVDTIDRAQLPEELRKLDDVQLKARIAELRAQRTEIQKQITELSRQREAFLAAEQKRLAAAGRGDSFDEKVVETLRAQALKKNINYK
jgi:hypothetical protein